MFADVVKMVTLQGKPRVSKKQLSELQFNFQIESISKYQATSFTSFASFSRVKHRVVVVCSQFVYQIVYWHSTSTVCKVEVSRMARLRRRLAIRVELTGYLAQISMYLT